MQFQLPSPSGKPGSFARACRRLLLVGLALSQFLTTPAAQSPAFQSPGSTSRSTIGQTTRFSTEFNPAIGAVIDLVADYVDAEAYDGFDASLRLFELNVSSYIDPVTWAYVAIASEDGESPTVEEAAIEYTGLSGNQSLKAGRFFVDFGKQMQQHAEELRTLERPLPLREYLGAELGGVGLQYDNWFAAGDATPVRLSLGVFTSLSGEGHHHEEGHEEEPDLETSVPARKDIDEFSLTARLTGMTDVGETGLLQLGASARLVPEYSLEYHPEELESTGLSNSVFGLDATFSRSNETGLKTLLLGGEYLVFSGDLAGELDDPLGSSSIEVVHDDVAGFYLFGDYGWDGSNSVGVQYAMADLPESPDADTTELDIYWTKNLTEYRRLRLGVTFGDMDGEDSTRIYLQFTNYFGNHSHGLNW